MYSLIDIHYSSESFVREVFKFLSQDGLSRHNFAVYQ